VIECLEKTENEVEISRYLSCRTICDVVSREEIIGKCNPGVWDPSACLAPHFDRFYLTNRENQLI
jgi:hypothetical protein